MTPSQWITNGEVGISSQTIWAVLTDSVTGNDFRRCWLLMQLVPDFKGRLSEVSDRFPQWIPFVREWDRLSVMLRDVFNSEGEDRFDEMNWKPLNEAVRMLVEEGYELDGWVRTGPHSWKKPTQGANA